MNMNMNGSSLFPDDSEINIDLVESSNLRLKSCKKTNTLTQIRSFDYPSSSKLKSNPALTDMSLSSTR